MSDETTVLAPGITSTPDVQGGRPVIAGTRIPTGAPYEFHRDGFAPEEIRVEYPSLTLEQIGLAIAFEATKAT